MKLLRRVAVLGAGTMGSRIAAHFANAGIPALLLDIVSPHEPDRNAAARKGLETALKQKPGAFFTESQPSLITPGNFEDNLGAIGDCDWIIEAVAENLEIKRALLRKVEPLRAPSAIVSTNTSGIPLAQLSEGFGDAMRRHFLGTHFFNPPRYLHLVELIPGRDTLPEVVDFVSTFCDLRLGKGVVVCKDTPNFIANRIGCSFAGALQKITVEDDYSIEEVDALTGPLIGLPKSASYRLMDIVGLDVWAHVARNLYESVPKDPWRERFVLPPFMQTMVERGWLGDKTGQGFYKRVGAAKEIHAIDWKTLEYHPAKKVRFPSVDAARNIEGLPERLRTLIASPDRAGSLLWKLFRDHVVYAAGMVPEISDRIVEIDRAMRWGYANALGPFELWDALDFPASAKRIVSEGGALPPSVEKMLSSGATSFYRAAGIGTEYFDFGANAYRPMEERPGIIILSDWKRASGVVKKNPGASLVDIGDGVLCLEFHGKMNSIGDDTIAMIHAGIDETARNFEALLVANQGENFSAGANLLLVLLMAQDGEWDDLDLAVRRFQQANMAMKYSSKPVVAAPFGMALGGGCEIAMHAARRQASAECYLGLVEVGAGVIPAGGGCKELLLRFGNPKRAFELIGYGKVSSSAEDARAMRLLLPVDEISMNPERLIADAKALALQLAPHYVAPAPRTDIPVAGDAAYALLKLGVYMARQGAYISDYDAVIGEKLAYVLSGGRLTGEQKVSEQYLLDLEREAFLSLCGQPRTQERMQHLLKTGKPLRN
jgi:3-hydroxyacyl-CoA dehydrogenase